MLKSYLFKENLTLFKAKQPLKDMELQEKEEKGKRAIWKLFKKSPKKKFVYQLLN